MTTRIQTMFAALQDQHSRHGPVLTQVRLAKHLRVSRLTINQLMNGRRRMTAQMALRLEHAAYGSAEQWLLAQLHDDLTQARRHHARRRKA